MTRIETNEPEPALIDAIRDRIEDCEYWMSRMDGPRFRRWLLPGEFYSLFYTLGELKLRKWRGLKSNERRWLGGKVRSLESRLSNLIAETTREGNRLMLLHFLEQGIGNAAKGITLEAKRAEGYLGKGLRDPRYGYPSIEFDYYVLTNLDELGFAIRLTQWLGLEFSKPTFRTLRSVGGRIDHVLALAVRYFRSLGQPIDLPDRIGYPRSFWWRHIHQDSTEEQRERRLLF